MDTKTTRENWREKSRGAVWGTKTLMETTSHRRHLWMWILQLYVKWTEWNECQIEELILTEPLHNVQEVKLIVQTTFHTNTNTSCGSKLLQHQQLWANTEQIIHFQPKSFSHSLHLTWGKKKKRNSMSMQLRSQAFFSLGFDKHPIIMQRNPTNKNTHTQTRTAKYLGSDSVVNPCLCGNESLSERAPVSEWGPTCSSWPR